MLELPLLASEVSHESTVLTDKLGVFALNLIKPHALIFLAFSNLTQICVKVLKMVALLALKLLCKLFVEGVFFLEKRQLLRHLLVLKMVRATLLFDLRKHLGSLSQLTLKETIGFK